MFGTRRADSTRSEIVEMVSTASTQAGLQCEERADAPDGPLFLAAPDHRVYSTRNVVLIPS